MALGDLLNEIGNHAHQIAIKAQALETEAGKQRNALARLDRDTAELAKVQSALADAQAALVTAKAEKAVIDQAVAALKAKL